jgi:hypothetical protein
MLILQVNGQPTPDLDTFLSVVSPLKDGDFARVKVCHLETTQQKVMRPINVYADCVCDVSDISLVFV